MHEPDDWYVQHKGFVGSLSHDYDLNFTLNQARDHRVDQGIAKEKIFIPSDNLTIRCFLKVSHLEVKSLVSQW
jgi:hypothetical protein